MATVGAKELEKKRKRRDKHMRRKEHNKQVGFYRSGKIIKTWISFHLTFTRKRYLKGKKRLHQFGRNECFLELF